MSEAVDETVNECLRNGVLEDILRKNRAEVMDVVLTEYDEERHIKNEKELSYEEGQTEALLIFLEALGDIPDRLRQKIIAERDTDKLKSWIRYSSQAHSIEEFEEIMNSSR